jgi:tetratricopeptide (TPR) repeat protein
MKTPNNTSLEIVAQNASIRLRAGDLPEAETLYQQILKRDPRHRDALFAMWQLQLLQGKDENASTYESRFLALKPGPAELQWRKGRFLHVRANYTEALVCFRQALAMGEKTIEVYQGMGNALLDQGNPGEAIDYYEAALKIQPRNVGIFALLAEAYRGVNRFKEAISYARRALAIDPSLSYSQCTIAWTQLLLGDYKAGLALNEKRFNFPSRELLTGMGILPNMEKFAAKPRWQGEDLQGKTLLVWCEQGLGDNIMMARYLPLLASKGAGSVIVYTQPALVKIMLTLSSQVVDSQYHVSPDVYDLQCSIMSLPYLFGTTMESIPANVPYLQIAEDKSRKWREQLRRFDGIKVGIVWAGNKTQSKDKLRSVTLDSFAPFLDLPGVQFVSLQKDEAANQLEGSKWRILNFMDACNDLFDTAALVSTLDLVISVDTSVVHLAGALGKPVWLLNRFESEWRWMTEREDSPWYPTLRIFSQPALHDWASVMARIADELARKCDAQAGKTMSQPDWEKAARSAAKALGIGKTQGGVLQKLTSLFS